MKKDSEIEKSKIVIGIVGFGEIGKSLSYLYPQERYDVYILDKDKAIMEDFVGVNNLKNLEELKTAVDVLNICIPYTSTFVDNVSELILKYNPELTIIHSTVMPKTTRKIYKKTRVNIVHSPIMGVHPNLTEAIETFTKIVGPITVNAATLACNHFKELGIDVELYPTPEDSEMSKLLSTTYYAWNIYFMQKVYDECKKHGLDFDYVYKKTNEIYNAGYTKLGMTNVVRPVLTYMGKGIGGHCQIENCIILHKGEYLKNISSLILNLGKVEKTIIPTNAWLYAEIFGKNRGIEEVSDATGIPVDEIKKRLELK